jgi:hypothetical protein
VLDPAALKEYWVGNRPIYGRARTIFLSARRISNDFAVRAAAVRGSPGRSAADCRRGATSIVVVRDFDRRHPRFRSSSSVTSIVAIRDIDPRGGRSRSRGSTTFIRDDWRLHVRGCPDVLDGSCDRSRRLCEIHSRGGRDRDEPCPTWIVVQGDLLGRAGRDRPSRSPACTVMEIGMHRRAISDAGSWRSGRIRQRSRMLEGGPRRSRAKTLGSSNVNPEDHEGRRSAGRGRTSTVSRAMDRESSTGRRATARPLSSSDFGGSRTSHTMPSQASARIR